MQKWLWVLLALIISSSIYFSIRYGLRPKPIPIMKPTEFASYEEMGVVTYRRLRQQIRSEKIIVLGADLQKPDTLDVWMGLVKAAVADKVRIQSVLYESQLNLPAYFDRYEKSGFSMNQIQDIKNGLIQSRRRDGIVVVLASNQDSSHLRKDSLTKTLERSALGPIFSLSQQPLILSPEQLNQMSESCANLDSADYLSRTECIVFRFSKQHHRRRLDPIKMYGAVERYGLKEYLFFIYRP